jgi:hypothetical protein
MKLSRLNVAHFQGHKEFTNVDRKLSCERAKRIAWNSDPAMIMHCLRELSTQHCLFVMPYDYRSALEGSEAGNRPIDKSCEWAAGLLTAK